MADEPKQEQLSAKHQEFINWYLRLWNQTEAYKRVYPKSSDAAARGNAARLIANDNIAAEIQRRIDEQTMSANEVLMRLGEQARAEYSQYITSWGFINIPQMIAEGKAHLIKGIKETAHGRVVEFHDAQAALIHIGKHHKLFTEKVEHDGEIIMRVVYGDEGTDDPPT